MQDPNEDTEWNDVLRSKGILPPKKEVEVTEETIVDLVEQTIKERADAKRKESDDDLSDLDEMDENEERILAEMRARRMAEMKEKERKEVFGEVREISATDYVQEVNKAGEDVWVVLHLYKSGLPLCSKLNAFINNLAAKFRATKFLKSVASTCIPNYPDHNLPTIFIYKDGQMRQQFIGPVALRGDNVTQDEIEFMLGRTGAINTEIKEDPRKGVNDVMMNKLRSRKQDDDSDDNDW